MSDETEGHDAEAPPTSAEIRRRSVMPRSEDPLVFPSGKIAQDPKRYNVPDAPPSVPAETSVIEPPRETVEPAYVQAAHTYVEESPALEDIAPHGTHPPVDTAARLDVSGSSRKWILWVGVGVGALAVIAILIATLAGGEPAAPPGASPTPSPSVSPTPTEAPSVGFGLLDDGIAEDEYPAAAPHRGEGFPDAYVMEEWVWDKTGPGWALSVMSGAIYGEFGDPVAESGSWVYLNSPEGAAFELFALPDSYLKYPAIVGWLEDERKAWILADYGETGALFDLTTGVPDPLSFRMSSGSSQSMQLASALADNTELWVARGSDWSETRVIKRSPEGEWTRVLPQSDFYFTDPWASVSPDRERVLFPIYSDTDSGLASARSGSDLFPNFVVYNLKTGAETFVRPDYPGSGFDYCYFDTWRGSDPTVTCGRFAVESGAASYEVSGDGTLRTVAVEQGSHVGDLYALEEYTDAESNLTFVSAVDSERTYELRLARGDEDIVLAAAGEDWSRAGVHVARLVNVKPGVYRIETIDAGAFLVDTENAIMTRFITTRDLAGSQPLPTTAVYFGEVSSLDDYNAYRYYY